MRLCLSLCLLPHLSECPDLCLRFVFSIPSIFRPPLLDSFQHPPLLSILFHLTLSFTLFLTIFLILLFTLFLSLSLYQSPPLSLSLIIFLSFCPSLCLYASLTVTVAFKFLFEPVALQNHRKNDILRVDYFIL